MTKYIIFIFFLFVNILILPAKAQRITRNDVFRDSAKAKAFMKEVRFTGQRGYVIDSTLFYLANTFGQNWFNNERYRVTERDRWGNLIEAVTFEFDTVAGVWFENDRYNETYYDSTNIALWMARVWDQKGQKWRLSDSVGYYYGNLPAISWYKVWDPFKFRFSRGKRVTYLYDGDKLSFTNTQKFDTLSGNWKNYQETFYSYLPDIALPDTELVMEWDTLNFIWKNVSMKIYLYNDNNLIESETTMLWGENNQWENNLRVEYEYGENGLPEQKLFYSWFFGDWDKNKRDVYSYDDNNRLSKTLSQIWDDFGHEWINTMMTVITYNEAGQRVELLYMYWSTYEYWVNLSKYLYTYDEHGNRVEFMYKNWDEDLEQWVNYYKNVNYWSEFIPNRIEELSLSQMNIFPNPTTGLVTLTVDEDVKYGNLSLYSMEGQLAFRKAFSGNTTQFDLTGLPKGVYDLTVVTNSGYNSQLLIIQ